METDRQRQLVDAVTIGRPSGQRRQDLSQAVFCGHVGCVPTMPTWMIGDLHGGQGRIDHPSTPQRVADHG
jgi:hypothetical protein